MKNAILVLIILVSIFESGAAAKSSLPMSAGKIERRAAETITAEELRMWLQFIAADEMEGRDTPSRGLDLTAKFIAMQLEMWGIKPAGDAGTYFQKIALRRTKMDASATRVALNERSFVFGEDFITSPRAGLPVARVSVSAPLVFAGNGWIIKAKNVNPYESISVKDKIVVILAGMPDGMSLSDLTGKQSVDWEDPITYAKNNGAKAVVSLPDPNLKIDWNTLRRASVERSEIAVERYVGNAAPRMPIIMISRQMAAALFQGENVDAERFFERKPDAELLKSFDFSANKKIDLTLAPNFQTVYTHNVAGIVEGSDARLKNEYVAIGAHHDHVGIGPPDQTGDRIYNGADDDGSGTVAALALAKAYATARARPKRSILFVWHAGEEKGMWGSRYFSDVPLVPLDKIVAQLNLDMIGRSRRADDAKVGNKKLAAEDEIYVLGATVMSLELKELSERVNRGYLNLKFNYEYDNINHPERKFFRSDHYHYARKGIPIIFFSKGGHEDYHKPSDTAEKIDYAQMEKVTRTVFMTAWELANVKQRMRLNESLPTLPEDRLLF